MFLLSFSKLIKTLQEENLSLKEKNEVLEAQIERLSFKSAYDPRATKVLHVKHNPFQQEIDSEKKKMDELIDENMKLKEVDEFFN